MTKEQPKSIISEIKKIGWRRPTRVLLFYFFLFNLIIYGLVASQQAIGRPHPVAKLCMSGAVVVYLVYITPLTKVFGHGNPLTKPFYLMRDAFYYAGIKALPENDAEREMLWYLIRYTEFNELVEPEFRRKDAAKKPIRNLNELIRWTDEIYDHARAMTRHSFRDSYFKKARFNIFYGTVWTYVTLRPAIYSRAAGDSFYFNPFIRSDAEIARLEELQRLLIDFRERTRVQEPEGLDFFYNETERWFGDVKTINITALFIALNHHEKKQLRCDDPQAKLFLETRKTLLEDMMNDKRMTGELRTNIVEGQNHDQFIQLLNILTEQCPQLLKKPDQPIDMRNWREPGQ